MLTSPSALLTQPLMMHAPAVMTLIDETIRFMLAPQVQPSQIIRQAPPSVEIALYDSDGSQLIPESIEGPDGEQRTTEVSTEGREPQSLVAVVSISGVMTRHGYSGWWNSKPGTAQIGRALQKMDADPAIHSIVLNINSPGGTVSGTPELAEIVFEIREGDRTKIYSVCDDLMASAAMYVGSASEKIYSIPSAYVGSIGTLMSYTSYAEALKEAGIKVDYVRTPDKKARFTGVEPLTDEMRETMEERIKASQKWFDEAMARHREVSIKYVQNAFGQGEVMRADEAIEAKLIDELASLDDVVMMQADEIRSNLSKNRRRQAQQRLDGALESQQELEREILGESESAEESENDSTETSSDASKTDEAAATAEA